MTKLAHALERLPISFRPLHDFVLVKRLEPDTMAGSLHLPDVAKTKAQRGEIVAVGRGRVNPEGVLIPTDVKPGEWILFGKYSGEDIHIGGVEHIILREDEVLAIVPSPGPENYRG